MNTVFKTFLSMSFSGSLLILVFFAGKRLLRDKISRQWQYYIWLLVILRLLLPFGPETSLMGQTYQEIDRAVTRAAPSPQTQDIADIPDGPPAVDLEREAPEIDRDMVSLLVGHIWLVWLVAALGLLIRKITVYQSFIRYIHAGLTPVSDMALLDQLSVTAEQAGVRRPVELCINPLVSSPLLMGFFRPCIVLPGGDIQEKDFRYIVLHELTHYKRRDMFYKWLVQVTVCLHWFNPLVHLMSREITRACEFSCDEAVLTLTGCGSAQDYGKTLLDAMAAVGKYRESLGSVTLSENKKLLKERLGAIMGFRKQSRAVRILTGVLTVCVVLGASFIGVYQVASADASGSVKPDSAKKVVHTDDAASVQAETYYKAGSLPLLQIAFSRMDQEAQRAWLDRIYEDGDVAAFSVCVNQLSEDSPLPGDLAEKIYEDGNVAFFSVLTDVMREETLEDWLDRALEDKSISFQAMLFDKLDMDDEKDAMEEEWAAKQLEEYRAHGVTKDGKAYYYEGQLVNIFLDIRKDSSFYTLDLNPQGAVNIKITRDENGTIKSVGYMTEAEAAELLGDMADPDDGLGNVAGSISIAQADAP